MELGRTKKKEEKKKKLRKEAELDLCPLEEAIKREVSCTWEIPSPAGKSAGTAGSFGALEENVANWFEVARMERNLYIRSVPSLCTPAA